MVGFLRVNQRLTKTFQSLIDNRQEICYTIGVIQLQIHPKEAIVMMNIYTYRIVFVSPVVYWTQGLYGFLMHIRYRVCFLFAWNIFLWQMYNFMHP